MVSVIVCVYNGSRFLGQALESALAQTYRDFEILVVDDGSTDGSAAIASSFGDPRIRVLRQNNRGAVAAMAAGLSHARGEYIAFLDQDDLWEPGKLETHLATMDRDPSLDLTFSWFRYVDASGKPLGIGSIRYRGGISFAGLLEDFVIGATSNTVLRRAAIDQAGGIDASIPRMHDLDLFLRIALLRPGNIMAIPAELMAYRRHDAQISRDFKEMEQEWERVMAKMACLAPSAAAPVLGRARVNIRRYFARLAYEQGRYGKALAYAARGFGAAPGAFLSDRRNWLTAGACLCGVLLPEPLLRLLEKTMGLRRAR